MNEWLLITGMAVITLIIRYPVVAMSGRIQLSKRFLNALRYVPPSVLTAIVVPAMLMPNGVMFFSAGNARLVGAIVAIAVGVWRQNLLLTIVVGMGVFFGWQWLLSMIAGTGW